ncbi:MAG TPA: anti-sigma factor antagonist [Ignavibacteriaceae bacterium]|nr:anti-sigma factor antagonist [Ignavibacteriaceae bacterium]
MQIDFEFSNEVLVIKLSGKFDSLGSIEFEKSMVKYSGQKHIIIDFSDVKYLSSAGIRDILKLEKDSKISGGIIVLCSLNQSVNQVFTMTGLKSALTIARDLTESREVISKHLKFEVKNKSVEINDCQYHSFKLSDSFSPLKVMLPEDNNDEFKVFSIEELKFSLGRGGLGLNKSEIENNNLIFTIGDFLGIQKSNGDTESDYLFIEKKEDVFLFLKEVVSFSTEPNYCIDFFAKSSIPLKNILTNMNNIVGDEITPESSFVSYVFFGKTTKTEEESEEEWIVGTGMLINKTTLSETQIENLKQLKEIFHFFNCTEYLCAGQIDVLLKFSKELSPQHKISNDLKNLLTFQNVKSVEQGSENNEFQSGRVYFFNHKEIKPLLQSLEIENLKEYDLTDEFEIIVRRIYSDCSRIQMTPLFGGFSARTFQVFGEDKNGAKILPTVLKLSNSAIIKREEDNFEMYVRKFILNNASTVMGAFYYSDFGGIRYNFLGITGSTKLKWLRKLYNERTFDEVLPLFEKVYTGILKPWYGQPKLDNINLFKEQNPINYFPIIYDKAKEELGISADDPKIYVEELKREITNPYYFLKYGYAEREKISFTCYKGICHGDLNLQNILLDEKENIYIIDFSETKYRNAVSDFSRLEPIIKFEYFNIESKESMNHIIDFETALMKCDSIKDKPEFCYTGNDPEVEKGYKLILKMREYASTVSLFEKSIVPYLIAMLEWSLPVVVYYGLNNHRKRYSMISCALITEKILEIENLINLGV